MTEKHDSFISIEQGNPTLQQALDQLHSGLDTSNSWQLLNRLSALSELHINGVSFFSRPVDRHRHVCIHIVLGRGFHIADEAFMIGYMLGCCNKACMHEQKLYQFASKTLFPLLPELDADARCILKDAIKLGYISNSVPLDRFDFKPWLEKPVRKVRQAVGIEPNLLRAYYAVEKRRYPNSFASQYLLPSEPVFHIS